MFTVFTRAAWVGGCGCFPRVVRASAVLLGVASRGFPYIIVVFIFMLKVFLDLLIRPM
jgi:hypothetical protein